MQTARTDLLRLAELGLLDRRKRRRAFVFTAPGDLRERIEAAAAGLPVLAGSSGGSPETVVPGETGFVVDSVDDIVDGLEILLADPLRAREMGAKGRARVVEEYVWDRVVSNLVDGFRS